jgi:2-polyprenyl-3-methyl-5-hydroxy-6-metoxy-1,4-benzoquinol methylase
VSVELGAPHRGDELPESLPEGSRDVPCLFCDVQDERILFKDGPFRVVSCARCGHVYVNPRLPADRLHEMYQEEYWNSPRAKEFGYTRYLAERELYERTYRRRSDTIERYKRTPGRVLDIGCAAGFFLRVMADKGWDTVGVEISAPMVEYARDELQLPDVRRADVLTTDLEPGSFDVITLWDVIEHLEDPLEHLRAAHRLLHRNGILVLETQNVRSGFARLLGRKWQHYKHEEHLYHFHPETLDRLLMEAQLEIVENTPRHGGKYVSMHFLQERVGKIHPTLSVLASPLKLLGDAALYLNFRDEMIAVAKKR